MSMKIPSHLKDVDKVSSFLNRQGDAFIKIANMLVTASNSEAEEIFKMYVVLRTQSGVVAWMKENNMKIDGLQPTNSNICSYLHKKTDAVDQDLFDVVQSLMTTGAMPMVKRPFY